eukprot:jgi/Botrbrau1/2123/Bobra.0093s0030.1
MVAPDIQLPQAARALGAVFQCDRGQGDLLAISARWRLATCRRAERRGSDAMRAKSSVPSPASRRAHNNQASVSFYVVYRGVTCWRHTLLKCDYSWNKNGGGCKYLPPGTHLDRLDGFPQKGCPSAYINFIFLGQSFCWKNSSPPLQTFGARQSVCSICEKRGVLWQVLSWAALLQLTLAASTPDPLTRGYLLFSARTPDA